MTSYIADYAWWRVVLDKTYYITNVDIYFKFIIKDGNLIQNVKFYVSSNKLNFKKHLCATISKRTNVSLEFHDAACKDPYFVNFLMIERFMGPKRTLLVLCGVQLNNDIKTDLLTLSLPDGE